jgi:hypothetical protein
MYTKKEVVWILVAIIILAFIIIIPSLDVFEYFYALMIAAIIILINVFAKKLAGEYFSVDIEHKIWELSRFGYYEKSHFKKSYPFGLIIPFFFSIFSLGYVKVMCLLQFDAKPSKKRILRLRGTLRKKELNDSDLGFIVLWGEYALIFLAIITAMIKAPDIAKYAIFYGFWNLVPIGQLDGTKLFFGSVFNWIILVILYIIALFFVIPL